MFFEALESLKKLHLFIGDFLYSCKKVVEMKVETTIEKLAGL